MKKLISIAIVLFLVVTCVVRPVNAASSTGYVYVNAEQDYKEVQNALKALNKERKKAGLKAVKLDQELCDLAVKRTAETSVYIGSKHQRPNGKARETISSRLDKENWSLGYKTGTSVIENAWMTSASHKKNMMYDKAVSVGIGFTRIGDNFPYCILILSSTKVKKEMTTKTGTKNYNVKVEVLNKYLKSENFAIKERFSDEFELNGVEEEYIYYDDVRKIYPGRGKKVYALMKQHGRVGDYVPLDPRCLTWSSSNKLIANVNSDGEIKPKSNGEAIITAKLKPSLKVTTSQKVTVVGYYDEYDYDEDPYYPDYFEVEDYETPVVKAPTLKATTASAPITVEWFDPTINKWQPDYMTISGLEVTDEIEYRLLESSTENTKLYDHVSIKCTGLMFSNGKNCVVDTNKHTVSFKDAGEYYIQVEGDDEVSIPSNGVKVQVTKPLQSVKLTISPSSYIKAITEIGFRASIDGGRGNEIYDYVITDASGKTVKSYHSDHSDDYLYVGDSYDSWSWTPKILGTFHIKVSVYDKGEPDIVVTAERDFEIVKGQYPPNVPQDQYLLPRSGDPISKIYLPEGWTFSAEDLKRTLTNNETIDLVAYYVGDYPELYETTQKTVTVGVSTCSHANTETRNMTSPTCIKEGCVGDEYCSDCGLLLEKGETLPIDSNHHVNVITTVKPAGIYVEGHTEHQYCKDCKKVIKQGEFLDAIKTYDVEVKDHTYNGKAKKANKIVFKAGNKMLKEGRDYTVSYSKNKSAGRAFINYEFIGDYEDTFQDFFDIDQASNTLNVKAKTPTVKYSKLKKKAQTITLSKAMTLKNKGQGTLTYTKSSGNKSITINKKTGTLTVKKGLKKGTYNIKVKVKAAGNSNYKSATKTITIKVKVS